MRPFGAPPNRDDWDGVERRINALLRQHEIEHDVRRRLERRERKQLLIALSLWGGALLIGLLAWFGWTR